MNKIYSVLRIDSWNNAQEVYTGRIRDCKKSLKTIGEEYPRRGLSYISSLDAKKMLGRQLIMGDSGDNVGGLPKYGKKKASEIIDHLETEFGVKRAVIETYKKVYGDAYIDPLMLNFRLLYLGKF